METECWFRRKDVGFRAISDANLLKNSVFRVLRKHFNKEPYYVKLLEYFEHCAFRTAVGQLQMRLMKIPTPG
jgi:farnesyl diphosphate synthase